MCPSKARALPAADPPSRRLPADLAPEIYAWSWHEAEFQPDGFRPFIDLLTDRSDVREPTSLTQALGVQGQIHSRL
jgi:hypothetical protein